LFDGGRLALTLTAAFPSKRKADACGSDTNGFSSYDDSYAGAFCACVWLFYGVYVFFRKAYCYKKL